MRLNNLQEVITIDECCKIQTKVLRVILGYLATGRCQVVCSADYGRIPPWDDKEGPHTLLEEWAGAHNTLYFDTDYRCISKQRGHALSVCSNTKQCQTTSRLHEIKARTWRQSDSRQLAMFREEWTGVKFDKAIGMTSPDDTWVCQQYGGPSTAAAAKAPQRELPRRPRCHPLRPGP